MKSTKLIYGLIYPSILGSMIYEILSQITTGINGDLVTGFTICIIYCIDYWYLYDFSFNKQKTEKPKNIIINNICDLSVPFLLGTSYFYAINNNYTSSFAALLATFIVLALYIFLEGIYDLFNKKVYFCFAILIFGIVLMELLGNQPTYWPAIFPLMSGSLFLMVILEIMENPHNKPMSLGFI